MQLAQPVKDFSDPNVGRINADDHHGGNGFCPLCREEVVSVFENGIWQWVHKYGSKGHGWRTRKPSKPESSQ